MLSVTGLNHFYYVRDFTDMRCKHSRVLSIIRERLHREPCDGDVFIVMSRNRRIVRMFSFDNRSYSLFERKLTTQRNNSLHYGSDAGAEMAATYHSVIGTVKLHGSSIWSFIGTFFKNIFNGRRDYVNMVPDKITLATSQC